jgi:hypothetical protein
MTVVMTSSSLPPSSGSEQAVARTDEARMVDSKAKRMDVDLLAR